MNNPLKTILCIGGSDPSGGAGIQVDIPVAYAHGLMPLTAITAITSQNSQGVYDLFLPEPQILRLQLEVLEKDYTIDAVKIGMLGNADNVKVVTGFLKDGEIKTIVLDPVFKSSTGFNLLDNEGMLLLKEELLELTDVVTPNLDEAGYLAQINVKNINTMKEAAGLIRNLKVKSCIVKGGHLEGQSTDVVYSHGNYDVIEGQKIEGELRGTGCIYATALACNLAKGLNIVDSAKEAKKFVEKTIKNGRLLGAGKKQAVKFEGV